MTEQMHGACVLDGRWGAGGDSATHNSEPRVRIADVEHSPKQDTAKYGWGWGEEAVYPSFPPFQNCGIPRLLGYYLFKPLKKKSTERFLGKVLLPAIYGTHPVKFPKSR